MRTVVGSEASAPSYGSRCLKAVMAGAVVQTASSSLPSMRGGVAARAEGGWAAADVTRPKTRSSREKTANRGRVTNQQL